MTRLEKMVEYLGYANNEELLEIYNAVCRDTQEPDLIVHEMWDFDTFFKDYSPSGIAELLHGAHSFDINDSYFKLDSYSIYDSVPSSANYVEDLIEIDELAVYLIDYGCPIENEEIERILNDSDLED